MTKKQKKKNFLSILKLKTKSFIEKKNVLVNN